MPRPSPFKDAVLTVALTVPLTVAAHLLLLLLPGAPAPRPAKKPAEAPPFAVTAGDWEMDWSSSSQPMPLGADGSYAWGDGWRGHWKWDAQARRFHVAERSSGDAEWKNWRAELDADGKGTVCGDFEGTPIRVRRRAAEFLKPPRPTD